VSIPHYTPQPEGLLQIQLASPRNAEHNSAIPGAADLIAFASLTVQVWRQYTNPE
jgi:hypothetical protein